jgi:hypothetical protein
MLHAYPTNALTRRMNARAAGLERIIVEHGILPDLLTIAAGIALAILAILFWSVGRFSGLTLPGWYWALGDLGMTAATYAQLAQRREQQEAGERDR